MKEPQDDLTPKQRQEELKKKEYIASINRVIDYIRRNLGQDLPLNQLAKIAHFSPYHFHRLFSALVGENVGSFIQRLRLENAASCLRLNHDKTITDIAHDCGYSSSATFARAFKDYYGMTASHYRSGGYRSLNHHQRSNLSKTERNKSQINRKSGQAADNSDLYISLNTLIRERSSSMKVPVKVKQMPQMQVVYVRHKGPYNQIKEAFDRLEAWARPRGLYEQDDVKVLAVYHDDPQVTDPEQLSSSACITAPEDIKVTGDMGKMTIEPGQYAVARVEIAQEEFDQAWNALLRDWIPDSGFEPDDRPCYEIYLNDPQFHPDHKFIVDLCEPVKAV
jgi:AraC family transcriptional regulator